MGADLRKTTIVVLLLIAVIVGAAGFAAYTSVYDNRNSATTTVPVQLITSLAYAHWKSIGDKNITQVMSQYSTRYEALWWFVNGSSIGPVNGRYDCNQPVGPNNCSRFPASGWETFFNETKTLSYTVCNFTITPELEQRATIHADVWYLLNGMNITLHVPYEMDFQYFNSTWGVQRDWFGTSLDQSTVLHGVPLPSCTA